MKKQSLNILSLGACFVMSVVLAGCSGDPNSNVQTDLAKIPLPAGVSEKPVAKPFKSRAKRSSPPLTQQPGS